MLKLLDEIDFNRQLSQEPQLLSYIKQAAKQIEKEETDQLLKFKKPVFDEDLENHLIVKNIPDLKGKDKEQKFLNLFKGFLDKKGIGNKEGLESIQVGYKLVNGQKQYNRTLYIIYKTAATAKKAYQKLHQLKFDKQHTLACFTVKQFKDVEKISKEYHPPKLLPKKDLYSYNLDEKNRDQFLFTIKEQNKNKLIVKWFDHVEKKTDLATQQQILLNQGAKNVIFSLKGTYIAICQPEGVRLLGGRDLEQLGFYHHQGVTSVTFSPKQTYMITSNKGSSNNHENFIIWGVQSQTSLRQYKAQSSQSLSSFQFNSDETKLIICFNHEFIIFHTESVQVLKKQFRLSEDQLVNEGKIVKAQHLQKLLWHVDKITVTCVCYELHPPINAHPTSRIFSLNTQSKQEKKWKAIGQNIKKAEITVSNNGDWVSVSFKKIQKKNLSISTIYILNLLKREVETDVVEFKENVVSISWDKQNGRFGVVYELPTSNKNEDVKFGVAFFQIQVKDKIQQAVKFSQIAMTPSNRVILADNGHFFALFNIDPFSWGKYKYSLGIFTKDQKNKKMTIQIMKKNMEISYMSFFEMDASGRFLLAGTDKAYHIITSTGEAIDKDIFSSEVKDIQFRPRQLTKLSAQMELLLQEKEKEIKKKYEEEDQKRMNAIEHEKKREKSEKKKQFQKYLTQKRTWFQQFKQKRTLLRGFSQVDTKIKSAVYQYKHFQRLAK